MLSETLQTCQQTWRPLVLADLLFKAAATLVIAPLVAVAFRAFVALSGRDLLADEDILRFALSPLGIACAVLAGGLALGAVVLEQAVLLRILWAHATRQSTSVRRALVASLADAVPTAKLGGLLVASALLLTAPFLLCVGLVYWMLLTGHDINYYLADKPPSYWIAIALAAAVLLAAAAMVTWWSSARLLSIPILVVRRASVRQAIAQSVEVTAGHHGRIARWMAGWLAAVMFLPPLLLAGYLLLGRWLVQHVASPSVLVVVVGLLMLVHLALNIVVQLTAAVSFATIVWQMWSDLDPESRQAIETASLVPEPVQQSIVTWNRRRMLAAAVVAALAAGTIGALSLAGIDVDERVEIIAHRGGAAHAPENSLAAVRQAIEQQADWVEIDIQETSDGRLAVVHDRDLMRVAGAAVEVHSSTLEQLQQQDIGSRTGPQFAGERVTTLDDVLELTDGKVGLVIELKHYGFNQQLEQRTIDLVEQHGMADQVKIISLDRDSIAKVRKLRPEWPIGLLTAVAVGDLSRIDADLLAVRADIAKPAFIGRCHLAGRKVAAWTLNDRASLRRMLSRGVDYVITDDVPLAREVIAERNDMSLIERWLSSLAAGL